MQLKTTVRCYTTLFGRLLLKSQKTISVDEDVNIFVLFIHFR
jgi:hypothetical protein